MIKGKLTPEQLDTLLDRLGHDDAFREKLLGDPNAALAEYGLELSPAALHKPRKLPSKDELKSARGATKDKLSGNLGLVILLAE